MDDIKWVYGLIGVIYIVLVIINLLNTAIVKQELKAHTGELLIIRGFKRDFFTTIAWICIVVTLIINGLCLYGNKPLNTESILTTFLIIGMALISGLVKVIIVDDTKIIIGGYVFNKGDIKEYKVRQTKAYDRYNIVFSEDLNGYEGVMLYVECKQKEKLSHSINQLMD